MNRLAFFIALIFTVHAVASSQRCPFNQGNCPHPHDYVQDYGYGGVTSSMTAAAGQALLPLATVVDAVRNGGPVNPECVVSPGQAVTTGAARLWNGAGGEATRAELEAIQCAGENGRAYSFRGNNIQEMINTASNLDELQEELVFLTAVDNIRQFNECQNGLFRSYFDVPANRTEMLENAWNQFSDISGETKPRLVEELRRRSSRALGDSVQYCTRENCPQMTEAAVAAITTRGENTARIDDLRGEINALISRIPMANRDSMRVQMENLLLSEAPVTRQQFESVFDAEMRNLDRGVQSSRAFISGITVNDNPSQRLYCVDRELKENLFRSGQIETTIQAMGLQDILGNFSTRAANRYGIAGMVITEVALIPTYFVGYGAARLALRAGASSVRAIASGGRALASTTRAAMLGIQAVDYTQALSGAMASCSSDSFITRVEGRACQPEQEIGQVYEEASMAQCLTSVILPFASPLIGTSVRLANTRRLAALYEAGRPGNEIVVTASRGGRNANRNREITDEMRLLAGLHDGPRVAAVNRELGITVSDAQAQAIIASHRVGGPGRGFFTYTEQEIMQKGLILRGANFTAPQIRTLIERGFVGQLPEAIARSKTARNGFFSRLFGARTPAAAAPIPEDSIRIFRETGQEVLDPNRLSDEVSSVASVRTSDLFSPRFSGSADEMVRRNAFRDEDLYQGNRDLWWEDIIISGRESRSPLAQHYGADNSRRIISWPKRQIEASSSGNSQRITDLDSYRVVVNQTRGEDGRWADRSLEMIVRNPDGSYSPMFYVKQGDEWVPSRTFKGQPVRQACIGCHHRPPDRNTFTAFPFAGARNPENLASHYQPFAQQMTGTRATGGVPMNAPRPEVPSDFSVEAARQMNALDRLKAGDGLVGNMIPTSPGEMPAGMLNRRNALKAAVNNSAADISERTSLLRYGLNRQDVEAFQTANGRLPPEVFSESEAKILIERGLTDR